MADERAEKTLCPYNIGMTEDFGSNLGTGKTPHCYNNGHKPDGELCHLTPAVFSVPDQKSEVRGYVGECGAFFNDKFKQLDGATRKP